MSRLADLTRLAELTGQWQYLRRQSSVLEILRSWVTPAAAAGAFAKYLGVPSRWSILVAVLVPCVVELIGYILGHFQYRWGGVERENQLAMVRDPWKRRSLELAERTAHGVEAIHALLAERLPPGDHPGGAARFGS